MISKFLKVFITIAFVFGLMFFVVNIKFTEVTCVAQSGICSEEVSKTLDSVSNLTLFTASRTISEKLNSNVFVKQYSFQYGLPRKIIVHIVQNEPVYTVFDSKSNKKFLIDNEGVILGTSESSGIFPLRVDNFSYKVNEKVNSEYLFSLEIVSVLAKSYEISESLLKPEFLEVTLKNGFKALFPLSGDRDYLTGAFVLMYNQLKSKESGIKIDNNNINTIDLRFRDPVLTTRI